MTYECLMLEAEKEGVKVYEHRFISSQLKGLYFDNIITLNSSIETGAERLCVFAEELGHYYTSYGNILEQNFAGNRKQERRARGWAYEKIITLDKLIEAHKTGIRSCYELAEFLGVTENFIKEAVEYYKNKYGLCAECGEYMIYFEPLVVFRKLKIKPIKKMKVLR